MFGHFIGASVITDGETAFIAPATLPTKDGKGGRYGAVAPNPYCNERVKTETRMRIIYPFLTAMKRAGIASRGWYNFDIMLTGYGPLFSGSTFPARNGSRNRSRADEVRFCLSRGERGLRNARNLSRGILFRLRAYRRGGRKFTRKTVPRGAGKRIRLRKFRSRPLYGRGNRAARGQNSDRYGRDAHVQFGLSRSHGRSRTFGAGRRFFPRSRHGRLRRNLPQKEIEHARAVRRAEIEKTASITRVCGLRNSTTTIPLTARE